jgi:Protein of unknown function (DUF1559)
MHSMRLKSRPWRLAGLVGLAAVALLCSGKTIEPKVAAQDAKAAMPSYLERIPLDSELFGHLRVAEVYGGPIVQDARKALGKEADELEKKLEEASGIVLSNVETATFCFPKLPSGPGDDSLFLVVVSTKQPYDGSKLLAKVRKGEAKDKVVPIDDNMVLHLTSERIFAIMHKTLLDNYAKGPSDAKPGVLADAIRAAGAGKHTFVGGINIDQIPNINEVRSNAPIELAPFKALYDANYASLKAELGKDLKGELRITCKNGDEAVEAERTWKLLMKLAEVGLDQVQKDERAKKEVEPFLPFLKELSNTVKTTVTKVDGSTLQVNATIKGELPVAQMAKQILGQVGGAASRATSQNNLKQIGLAMHNYHDSFGGFPPVAICDKKGKPLLSWRVSILPFIEQDALYKEFKLDEPWDSDHNKKLLAKMPRVYMIPDTAKPGQTKTHYRVFYGNGAAFDLLLPGRFQDFQDGTSNTGMCFEAAEAVEWTKPDDLEFDPKKDPRPLLRFVNDVCQVAFADGSVRALSKKISEETLRAIITRSGGEVLGDDF